MLVIGSIVIEEREVGQAVIFSVDSMFVCWLVFCIPYPHAVSPLVIDEPTSLAFTLVTPVLTFHEIFMKNASLRSTSSGCYVFQHDVFSVTNGIIQYEIYDPGVIGFNDII